MNDSDITSEVDLGLDTAIELANALDVASPADPGSELRRVLAVDPPSLDRFATGDIAPLVELAGRVHWIVDRLIATDLDAAAESVNAMLAAHSAHPHLAFENGQWRLHRHPPDAALVSMWTAIAADAFARLIHTGRHRRLGRCDAPGCERIYLDTSKNASRRFCSTTCQNRVKAAAYRRRKAADRREETSRASQTASPPTSPGDRTPSGP